MSLSKLDIEKFIIIGDYSLWKLKMRTLLIHQELKSALEEKEEEIVQQVLNLIKRKGRFLTEHTTY